MKLARQNVGFLGVAFSHGSRTPKGTELAPKTIRQAGTFEEVKNSGIDVFDYGDLSYHGVDSGNLSAQEYTESMLQDVYKKVSCILKDGRMPFTIGGDHSISAGAILAAKAAHEDMGLIWIDAHDDSSGASEKCGELYPGANKTINHANVLAHLSNTDPATIIKSTTLGKKGYIPRKQVCLVSCRRIFKTAGYENVKSSEIDRAISIASNDGKNKIYMSFDIDALIEYFSPGTGNPDGMMPMEDAYKICRQIANSGLLVGADLVEFNPNLDEDNKTLNAAKQIILSTCLGK